MNYQSCTPNSQLSSSKGQYHLLLLRGIGYLLPLSLLGSGIAFPQSSPNSQPQSLQNVNQGASSSSLESLQASQEKQESALPDYESVPAMQINDSENQNKQGSSSPQSSSQEQQQASSQSQALSQSKQQQASSPSQSSSQEQQQASSQSQSPSQSSQGQSNLKPIQPLDNSSSPSPQTSSQNNSAQRKSDSPQKTTNSANDSSTPTVELEQRESEQSSNSTTAQSKQSPLPKLDNSKPQEKSTRNSASQDFIDSNTYPQQEERSLPAPKVEVSDRESNCKTVIENGKLVSGSCNNVSQGATNSGQSSSEQAGSEQARVKPEKLPELPKNFEQPNPSNNQPNPSNNQPNPSNNQERVKSTYTPPEDLPKLKLPGNGDSQLLFPLVAASAISADYGWRLHPVVGERRFHTGTDFAAPEGTPVVAAKSGRVSLADYRSGYGLMVGLRHNDKNESRYAHLSQIHVRPGQWVEQGTVIGRVGNTGLSTGPHLHFEWRIRKGSRWVVVNAKEQLLAARDNLDSSQLAYSAAGKGNKELQGGNFFANLPKVFASLPKQPASWMSLPQLDFLKNGDFDRAYERQAPLSNFSQRAKSVLVLPLSLPDVLASVLNWQPPQLFAEETLQRVPTQSQTGFGEEFVYRAPSPSNQTVTENYPEIARQSPKTIESATNMEALGTLNFSAPRPGNPQKLSDSSLKDSHVLPRRIQ